MTMACPDEPGETNDIGALDDDWYGDWIAAWRRAIRVTPHAVTLVELASRRFIELSTAAAELLLTTPEDGIGADCLAIAERRDESEQTFRLVEAGHVEVLQARRLFQHADGSSLEVRSWARAIRSPIGPDLGLWVVSDATADRTGSDEGRDVASQVGGDASVGRLDRTASSVADDLVVPPVEFQARLGTMPAHVAELELDRHWRVAGLNGNLSDLGLLREPLMGQPIIDMVHPDDIAGLLWAFAAACASARCAVRIRVRKPNLGWASLDTEVSLDRFDAEPRFSLALAPVLVADGSEWSRRMSSLERRLRRIAVEVEDAGRMGEQVEHDYLGSLFAQRNLSTRQVEIVTRLLRGERVSGIAESMFLSHSTVRNHLVVVFRKFEVGSQQELITFLRRATPDDRSPR